MRLFQTQTPREPERTRHAGLSGPRENKQFQHIEQRCGRLCFQPSRGERRMRHDHIAGAEQRPCGDKLLTNVEILHLQIAHEGAANV